jgi:hypothetical protein
MSLIRSLRRLALLGAAGALVKKALDRRSSAGAPAPAPAAPTPPPATQPEPVRATSPADTPGPSVTPPGREEGSETERSEAAEQTVPDPAPGDDALVAEEEAAAAAEAGGIGGRHLHDAEDPAFEAAYEAGGGESEGFEAAEHELEENATHGDGRGDPIRDAITPEVESDEETALEGEADEIIEADDRK